MSTANMWLRHLGSPFILIASRASIRIASKLAITKVGSRTISITYMFFKIVLKKPSLEWEQTYPQFFREFFQLLYQLYLLPTATLSFMSSYFIESNILPSFIFLSLSSNYSCSQLFSPPFTFLDTSSLSRNCNPSAYLMSLNW